MIWLLWHALYGVDVQSAMEVYSKQIIIDLVFANNQEAMFNMQKVYVLPIWPPWRIDEINDKPVK